MIRCVYQENNSIKPVSGKTFTAIIITDLEEI